MVDHQENRGRSSAESLEGRKQKRPGTGLLAEAVIELSIAQKKALIYPSDHIQVKQSIERAHELVCQVLVFDKEVTFGVSKDALIVGSDSFDPQNPVYGKFSASLRQHDIAAVTFQQGVSVEELARFLSLLAEPPEKVRAEGGVEAASLKARMPHISILAVDYSRIRFTEEEEILRTQISDQAARGKGIWHDFVTHLMSGTGPGSAPGTLAGRKLPELDAVELARFLNEHRQEAKAAVESYEEILIRYLDEENHDGLAAQEPFGSFSNLNILLEELNPLLRQQFLSSTFEQCDSQGELSGTEGFLGGLSDDLVVEMIQLANEEDREISPTLMSLIQKMAGTLDDLPAVMPSIADNPADIKEDEVKHLFNRESYEQFVIPEYDKVLKELINDQNTGGITDDASFSVEEELLTLDDQSLDIQIARALLAFMELEVEKDEYADYARKLLSIANSLPGWGEFGILSEIYESLQRHQQGKDCQGIRDEAEASLEILMNPILTERCIVAFGQLPKKDIEKALPFLVAIGPAVIPAALSRYCEQNNPEDEVQVFGLLSIFPKEAAKEALKRLEDPATPLAATLLILIRRLGVRDKVPLLKGFLEHSDLRVRMEALTVLLSFNDSRALPYLKDALNSGDQETVPKAIDLAGKYRVREVAPDLVKMIKRLYIFTSVCERNDRVITALGQLGDPCAIPVLEKIAKDSSLFKPQAVKETKLILFESLVGYPEESVRRLWQIGLKSRNHKIRGVCKSLMARQRKSQGRAQE